MGKVPKRLSSSAVTTAAAESNTESVSSRESVAKVEVPPWSFQNISHVKLQRLKVYAGIGILAVGFSATVAFMILKQRRRRKLKGHVSRYDYPVPKSEVGSTAEMLNAFEFYPALQGERRCERGESSRQARDIPGLETALLDPVPSEDDAYEHYSYVGTLYEQRSRRIKRWSNVLTSLIIFFAVLVFAWRNQHYFKQKDDATGESAE